MSGLTFASMIRQAREDRGLTQKAAAKLVIGASGEPISAAYLCDIELGKRLPTCDGTILALAHALRTGEDVLFILAGKLPPQDRAAVVQAEPIVALRAIRAFRDALDAPTPEAPPHG